MSSRNLSFTININGELPDIKKIIPQAIINNAHDFLNPPIKNLGYKGIKKTANEIKKWYKSSDNLKAEFQTSAMIMERAGTGGALFRNLYRDFLLEAYELTGIEAIKIGHENFCSHAQKWTEISELFQKVGGTKDQKFLDQACLLFSELSENEKSSMEKLIVALR